MSLDVIIKGGEVMDGTGAPRVKKDVGLRGDAIEAVGDLTGATAAKMVDAGGCVVTPGFIDMHSHSDQTVLLYPAAEGAVGQGITTSVGGQCGFSAAPLNKHWTACFWEWNWWDRVVPTKYYQEVVGALDRAREAALEVDGLDINWSTFAEWIERVEQAEPGINLAPLVGHSTVRTAVMGSDYRRRATPEETAAMKRLVEESMDFGAFGISNGMDYAPNCYCGVEESCEVIGAAVKNGGLFSSHWRRTGLRQGFGSPGLIHGLRETLDVAKRTGAKLEVAHLSPGYLISPSPTPKLSTAAAEETLAELDKALKEGVDLKFDVIPNHQSGGVTHNKYVAASLTPWLKEAGTMERFAENLGKPDLREEIKEYIMAGKWFGLNPILQPGWANAVRIGQCREAAFMGRTVADIARERDVHPLDALMDVIAADPWTTRGEGDGGSDEVKRVFYKHPLAMVGIDTFLVNQTAGANVPPYFLPNPNSFGGMARFIKLYAVGLLGLEEGIRRLTSMPAATLGLTDRGVIALGKKADLVVFKPEAVTDKGTVDEPRQYPEGFRWVFVNGHVAMADGKLTLARGGRVLRRA